MMQARIYSIAAAALVVLTLAGVAEAGYPLPEKDRRLITASHLTATGKAQTWESRPLTAKNTIYVHIYRRGQEIKQKYINGCAASYTAKGLMVHMRVLGCARSRWNVQLRYVSIGKPQRFKVRLTTSPCDPMPGSAYC